MLLSTAYLPPISYFKKIASGAIVFIEKHEHFIKQTYRNRCLIYGANGVHSLRVPLVNTHEKTLKTEKRIAYKEKWQNQHWRSIESANRGSPYFIYYEDALRKYYETKFEFLFEYNTQILLTLCKLLKPECRIEFTGSYVTNSSDDHRNTINPKSAVNDQDFPPYTQVFSDKHGFKPDLSIIDLLFDLGPQAKEYLNT
jgi:hypothetical protein